MDATFDTFRTVTDSVTANAIMTLIEGDDEESMDILRAQVDGDDWDDIRRSLVDSGNRAIVEAIEAE